MPCISLNYLWSMMTPVQYTEEEEQCPIAQPSANLKKIFFRKKTMPKSFLNYWSKRIIFEMGLFFK